MSHIRPCGDDDLPAMLDIINAAAQAYRGVIPPDRWHEPYMTMTELQGEMIAGVRFWGWASQDALVGIMGLQAVRDVDVIRHAYVHPAHQGHGAGAALIAHVRRQGTRPRMLVGTWAAAGWAIRFYQRHGFELVPPERAGELLRTYWTIPDRQIDESVVLALPPSTPM